jgi:membrane protease YdiL (CAAX protease family)
MPSSFQFSRGMLKSPGFSPLAQLFTGLFLVLFFTALIQLILRYFYQTLYGFDLAELLEEPELVKSYSNQIKLMLSCNQIFGFAVPAILMMYLFGYNSFIPEYKIESAPWKLTLLGLFSLLLLTPLMGAININPLDLPLPGKWKEILTGNDERGRTLLFNLLNTVTTIPGILLQFVVFALIPAIAEEYLFRGFLLRNLRLYLSRLPAILLSAFIFSAIHLEFNGLIPRFIIGVLLGFFAVRTGNLKLPILAHFTFNGLNLLLFYLGQQDSGFEKAFMDYSSGTPVYITLFLALPGAYLFYRFYKATKQVFE